MKPKQGQSVSPLLKSLIVSVAKRVTSSIKGRNIAGKPLSDNGSMPEFVNYVGVKKPILYEVHVIRNLNELGNSDWETVMKKKRRKTLVVCSKCHERIHRH